MKHLLKVLGFAKNLWPYYLVITIFSVLLALANQVTPFIVKIVADLVVDVAAGKSPDYWLGFLLAISFLVCDIAVTLFSNWGGFYGDIMAAKLKKQLSESYYKHLLTLPQSYYDQELSGTIINRLNRTIFELTNFVNFFANNFFQMILTTVFTLIIVAYYSWEVAILLFIVYPVFLWLTSLTSKQWQAYQAEKNTLTDVASGRFAETITQIKVVKSFIQEDRELEYFGEKYQHHNEITAKQSRKWHNMDILRRLFLNVIFFLILAFVFWQTLLGRFTVGEMFLIIQFAILMRIPLFSMSFIVDQTQHAIAGSRDYFKVMQIKPTILDKPGAIELKIEKGEIEYKDVHFNYDEKDKVLGDINFVVQPGQKVALVGESGEGKSTITNLLLRLYEPQKGAMFIDGVDIATVTQKSLREAIAVVFQDPALFSGTIIDNISYFNPNIPKSKIFAAAKDANAHEFINKLPDGYNTQIGEHGIKLSGGQKQRIAIARALLKNAPILILDEATSSLDSKAEAQVQEALERLMKGRTTLIIAHRLSTIAHVDKIVTIKDGTVHEVGTPEELAGTKGIYSELLHLQLGSTEAARKRLRKFEVEA